jgi:phage tail sheath protein FI
MPVQPQISHPGVYVQEVPSGVRTIVGVPTSITVFMGRTLQGPLEPTTINNYGDFERKFGGLSPDLPLTYTVKSFYLNGGSKAIIVRLFRKPANKDGYSKVTVGGLKVQSANPGEWGNEITVTTNYDGIDDIVAQRYAPLKKSDLFNLIVKVVKDNSATVIERFVNLSIKEGPRRVDRVLDVESNFIRVQQKNDGSPDLPNARPTEKKDAPLKDGVDSDVLKKDDIVGKESTKTGLYSLETVDLFNLLCIPPDVREGDTLTEVYAEAMKYCAKRRAMLIVDPPAAWGKKKGEAASEAKKKLKDLKLTGVEARNAALFFPRVKMADEKREGQLDTFVPCGIIAGKMAQNDAQNGVWAACAGIDASLNGIRGLEVDLTDADNGDLNPVGINCLRTFPVVGQVIWGARTLRGADQLSDEYKYISVRRVALYIEESLYRGLKWCVFKSNDEPLWSQIRLNVGAFMHNLYRQGAFQGDKKDAYFVKCDKETTTQDHINRGIVNIWVGFAPLKPAEFVILYLQQMAGQIET